MKLKTEVECVDPPLAPPSFRRELMKKLRGAKSLAIRAPKGTSFAQINRITFEFDSPREMPTDPIDEIVDQCVVIIHAHWLASDEPGPMKFRLQAELHAGSGVTQTRGRPYFTIVWNPDADVGDEEDEERRTMGWEMYDVATRAIDGRDAHISELHTVIIAQAQMNHAPLRAASQQMDAASQMTKDALSMLLYNMQAKFSTEAATAAEEGKTQRSEALWGRVGGLLEVGLQAAAPQLATWAKMKFGGGGGPAPAPPPRARRAPPQPKDAPDEDDIDDEGFGEFIIADLANLLGRSLDPHQRKDLRILVGIQSYALFDDVFTAETDDEVVEHVQVLTTSVDQGQMLQLHEMLTDDQKEMFGQLMQLVTAYEKPASDDDDDDDDADDED